MKRVKTERHGPNRAKQSGVRLSLLLTGLMLASAGAQASVTITAGNRVVDRIGGAVSISQRTPSIEVNRNAGSIIRLSPGYGYVMQPPYAPPLSIPSASSSVYGSMNYTDGASHGSFGEGDSSSDGELVALGLDRRGYGYRAEAAAQTGLARARAETKWAAGSGHGSSAASGASTWSDWFVISGGTGLGTASFASLLEGTMASGKSGSAGYSLNIGYTPGAYCAYWYTGCGEADLNQTLYSQSATLSGKGKSTLSQDVEGEFAFAYGKAFKLTVALDVSAGNGGMAEFSLASLGTSLLLPEGASLLSASGLPYVTAVPEADTYATMLAGLGLVGWAAMRRRNRAQ